MSKTPTATRDLPYLTADLPGVGGVIKRHDEDFLVEEIPLYPASGEGTHAYFQIEKRGLTTLGAIDAIARALGRKPRDIGYAGMKDAHGVTRQMLSVEHIDPAVIQSLDLDRIRVLSIARHTNKIKLGHLTGNRFIIKIRGAADSPLPLARPIVALLAARGLPNYFGPQRFGTRGDNAAIGLAVLRDDLDEAIALMLGRPTDFDTGDARRARELFASGDLNGSAAAWPRNLNSQARVCRALIQSEGDARKAWRAVDHTLRKLYVSSVQSELFNRVLARRINGVDRVLLGDVAWKHANGACFVVEDLEAESLRCAAFEISATGPLFGKKMKEPIGEPADLEADALAQSVLRREQIRTKDGSGLDGARRPLRVPVSEPDVDAGTDDHGPYLRLSFSLPKGAYATNVTREVCK